MKHRILVIDDEQIVLESVEKILTAEGCHVQTASSGKSGIALACDRPFDLVLTDIRMPDVNGLVVLRDIRRAKPSLPVVLITGYATIDSAVAAMKLGAGNYIEKPFTPEELVRTVRAAMEEAARAASKADQTLVHKKEVLKVLKKGASDSGFARQVAEKGAGALEKFDLTPSEKLAIVTGDVTWLEDQLGTMDPDHKKWLMANRPA
ncbi:MAG: sigma-54-dependent transcriptional regulator [Thermodesulfobacteriota bacterium]